MDGESWLSRCSKPEWMDQRIGAVGIVLYMGYICLTTMYMISEWRPSLGVPLTNLVGFADSATGEGLPGPNPFSGQNAPGILDILHYIGLAGIYGGMLYGIYFFYSNVHSGELRRKDMVRCYLFPFSGGIMAVLFYLVLRGGLAATGGTPLGKTTSGGLLFYMGVSGVAGMFSEEAIAFLKGIAAIIFKEAPKPAQVQKTPANTNP